MDQKKLFEYLTVIDEEIRRLMTLDAGGCLNIPNCPHYGTHVIYGKNYVRKLCEIPKKFNARYSTCANACGEYPKFVMNEIRKRIEIPEEILPSLISIVGSFFEELCSFRNDCKLDSKENNICNEELSLMEFMNSCNLYRDRMTKEILESLKKVKH